MKWLSSFYALLLSVTLAGAAINNGGGGGGGSPPDASNGLIMVETPEKHGAAGDGTTDDTTAVQAAITAAGNAGGIVSLGPHTYKITSTLTSTKACSIIGTASSTLKMTDAGTADIISFDPGLTPTTLAQGLVGCVFREFTILSTVARTSGYAIHIKYSHATTIENVAIDTAAQSDVNGAVKMWGGIFLELQSACKISHCEIASNKFGISVTGTGDGLVGSGVPYFGYDGMITGNTDCWGGRGNGTIQNSCGLYIGGGCGGLRVDGNCNFSFYDFGVYVDHSNRELWLTHSYADTNTNCGTYITSDGCSILHLDDWWGCGNGNPAVMWEIIGAGLFTEDGFGATVVMTGGEYDRNNGAGVDLGSVGLTTLSGVTADSIILENSATVTGYVGKSLEMVQGSFAVSGCQIRTATGDISAVYLKADSGVSAVTIVGCDISPPDVDLGSRLMIDGGIPIIREVGNLNYSDVP